MYVDDGTGNHLSNQLTILNAIHLDAHETDRTVFLELGYRHMTKATVDVLKDLPAWPGTLVFGTEDRQWGTDYSIKCKYESSVKIYEQLARIVPRSYTHWYFPLVLPVGKPAWTPTWTVAWLCSARGCHYSILSHGCAKG